MFSIVKQVFKDKKLTSMVLNLIKTYEGWLLPRNQRAWRSNEIEFGYGWMHMERVVNKASVQIPIDIIFTTNFLCTVQRNQCHHVLLG